jgi:hypothetical protein
VVGDHEAAGAIPVTQTSNCSSATVPRNGTRFCEDRRQRFNSSRWHQRLALIPPRGPYTHLSDGKELVVHALGCDVELVHASPSGTVPDSNPG